MSDNLRLLDKYRVAMQVDLLVEQDDLVVSNRTRRIVEQLERPALSARPRPRAVVLPGAPVQGRSELSRFACRCRYHRHVHIAEANDLLLISVHADDHLSVIALCGELDCSNIFQVDNVLTDALERRPEELVVDVSALRYIDSLGVAALLRARMHATNRHITFRVTGASGLVRRVFALLDVEPVLDA